MSDQIRRQLRARIAEEALADPRVKALERWALGLPDDEVAEAVELLTIGLDASRKARWVVLRTIDDELRQPGELLPHGERVTLLRWIVRVRETDRAIEAKLREIREAISAADRSRIIAGLLSADGDVSIENAHGVLAAAWRTAPVEARPTGDVHRGEPEPHIGARNTVRLVVWLARRVAHLVPKGERKAFDRRLALAATAVAAGRPSAALDEGILRGPSVGPASLARSACIEARASLTRPDMAGIAARPAAVRAVQLLVDADGPEAVRTLLAALDEELRRLDVTHALELWRRTPSRPVERAILRAEADGTVVLWLAELEGGRLGLLSREHGTWLEGACDEVLASVPDAHFERAVIAARIARPASVVRRKSRRKSHCP